MEYFDDLFGSGAEKKYTYRDALRDIRETQELIKDLRDNYSSIWGKIEDTFMSIGRSQQAVFRTIRQSERVSDAQRSAIENWGAAVRKWHPDYRD